MARFTASVTRTDDDMVVVRMDSDLPRIVRLDLLDRVDEIMDHDLSVVSITVIVEVRDA